MFGIEFGFNDEFVNDMLVLDSMISAADYDFEDEDDDVFDYENYDDDEEDW